MYNKDGWTFKSQEVADNFDNHVVQSVPLYQSFHEMITTFSKYYVQSNSTVVDLGTSTGHLLRKMANTNKNKNNVTYCGFDNSVQMINKARENHKDSVYNLNFFCDDVEYFNTYPSTGRSSFITSMLCLQFIQLNERKTVVKNVYDSLNDGGAFVMVEKIKSNNIDIHDIYNDVYYDFKRSRGLSDTEIIDKNVSLRGVMKPITLEENISMLQQGGFKTIEVFMKFNNFVGIIAIK